VKTESICILTTGYPKWPLLPGEFPNGKYVHDMAIAFVNAGHKVYVVTHNYGESKSYEVKDGVEIYRFNYFIKKWQILTKGNAGIPENLKKTGSKLLVPFYFLMMFFKSWNLIRKKNIDIINAHWAIPTGFIAVFLKYMTRKKLVTTIYGAELFPVIKGNMTILKPFIKYALNKANMVAGISKATVDAAIEISKRQDIHIIPDGIDTIKYTPGDRSTGLLNKYGINNERAVFFTGNMIERKGHKFLLQAISYVIDKIPDVKLILGGKGPMYDELIELRKKLKLQDIVIMPGFIPDDEIIPLLQSVDLYVLPSCIDKNGDTEGSATAALEAMACGTPSIITEVGGNVGAIIEGKGAFYCEHANSHDLGLKILTYFNLDFQNIFMPVHARDHVINNFSWKVVVENYENII